MMADMDTRLNPMSDNPCPVCQDVGYICAECNRPDGDCTCEDGPDLIRCPECTE